MNACPLNLNLHRGIAVIALLILSGCVAHNETEPRESPTRSYDLAPTVGIAHPPYSLPQTVPQTEFIFMIDFNEGFAGDTFSVIHEGAVIAEVELTSKKRGPADWISLESNAAQMIVLFRDERRSQQWEFLLDLQQGTYFSIDYAPGQDLTIRQSQRPFLYRQKDD